VNNDYLSWIYTTACCLAEGLRTYSYSQVFSVSLVIGYAHIFVLISTPHHVCTIPAMQLSRDLFFQPFHSGLFVTYLLTYFYCNYVGPKMHKKHNRDLQFYKYY